MRGSVTSPVRVNLLGLAPGEEVTVVWIPTDEVAVFAGAHSRFTTRDTLVQATLSGGPVRLELPSSVRPLTLVVNGRVWLRNLESGLELGLEARGRHPDTQRFVVPARDAPLQPQGT